MQCADKEKMGPRPDIADWMPASRRVGGCHPDYILGPQILEAAAAGGSVPIRGCQLLVQFVERPVNPGSLRVISADFPSLFHRDCAFSGEL
jgi:hypothetical protein